MLELDGYDKFKRLTTELMAVLYVRVCTNHVGQSDDKSL